MEMNSWFETTVAIDQMQDDGTTKSVNLKYLVDAFTFTEAEDRIIEEVIPFTRGNLEVKAVKRVRIAEIFPNDRDECDKWYRVKSVFIMIDEKTQAEKETPFVAMVQSSSVAQSICDFEKGMKGSLVDFRIIAVAETKIEDVFEYKAKPAAD